MAPVKPTAPAKKRAGKPTAMECFEQSAKALRGSGGDSDRAAQWRLLGIAISEHLRYPPA